MTAVELLMQTLEQNNIIDLDLVDSDKYYAIIEQAKQMEAEQTIRKNGIVELSDEEISIGAINFCTKNIDTEVMHWSDIFEYACKWYREQLKQRQ